MTSEDRGQLLADICESVVSDSDFKAAGGKTYCNMAALLVAQTMGCKEFDHGVGEDPLLADAMIGLMESNGSGKWRRATGSEATIHALGGGLAFAAKASFALGADHGHIAAICPLGMQHSGSLKKDVPLVANCGRLNGIMKVSQAFPVAKGEPDYFIWNHLA